ncbi:hypothetical protein M5D96_006194, partial [Drosophila gunungcola]
LKWPKLNSIASSISKKQSTTTCVSERATEGGRETRSLIVTRAPFKYPLLK